MRNDISKDGIKTQFSAKNRPDPKSMRKPKYKTIIKKIIESNMDVFEEQIKKGNSQFWNMGFERAYGKEVNPIEATITDKTIIVDTDLNDTD